jgi:hypothetical protein
LTSLETGNANRKIPDEEVLVYAIKETRGVLTLHRRHFGRHHLTCKQHFGIIACTEDKDPAGLAQRIHKAIEATENLENQLIKIYRPN